MAEMKKPSLYEIPNRIDGYITKNRLEVQTTMMSLAGVYYDLKSEYARIA